MSFSRLQSCYQVHSPRDFLNEDFIIFSCISGHLETLMTILLQKLIFLLQIALTNAAHPQVHFNDTQEYQASSQKNPERTNATSSASSYRRWWCTSRDLRPFARSTLIDLLGITILLCLSPNKLGMAIYLINEMVFLHLASNNTKYCAHLMSPSDQLSSPVDSSLSHAQRQQLRIVSLFQRCWVYKQTNLSQIIQYRLCSCLDNSSSSSSLHLALPAAPGCSIPRREDFVPEMLVAPTKRPQVVTLQVRLLSCWGYWRATKIPQVATSHVRPLPVYSTASRRFFVVQLLASLNCRLVPHFPLGIGRPCCGSILAPLCSASPCSCELALATWCHFIK